MAADNRFVIAYWSFVFILKDNKMAVGKRKTEGKQYMKNNKQIRTQKLANAFFTQVLAD